jgi:hypothetical protein
MNEEHLKSIKAYMEKVQTVFPEMSFRCEYDWQCKIYIIDVQPSLRFESRQYVELQYDFRHEFEAAFWEYELLFVSNSEIEIFKVKNPLFVVGPKKVASQPERKRSVVPESEYEPCYV